MRLGARRAAQPPLRSLAIRRWPSNMSVAALAARSDAGQATATPPSSLRSVSVQPHPPVAARQLGPPPSLRPSYVQSPCRFRHDAPLAERELGSRPGSVQSPSSLRPQTPSRRSPFDPPPVAKKLSLHPVPLWTPSRSSPFDPPLAEKKAWPLSGLRPSSVRPVSLRPTSSLRAGSFATLAVRSTAGRERTRPPPGLRPTSVQSPSNLRGDARRPIRRWPSNLSSLRRNARRSICRWPSNPASLGRDARRSLRRWPRNS